MSIRWEFTDYGKVYKCSVDETPLLAEYNSGEEVILNECPHFKWERVGNGCYPDPIDSSVCEGVSEIVKNSIIRVKDGTTFYFLLPTA